MLDSRHRDVTTVDDAQARPEWVDFEGNVVPSVQSQATASRSDA